jgi:hypothetical protein
VVDCFSKQLLFKAIVFVDSLIIRSVPYFAISLINHYVSWSFYQQVFWHRVDLNDSDKTLTAAKIFFNVGPRTKIAESCIISEAILCSTVSVNNSFSKRLLLLTFY